MTARPDRLRFFLGAFGEPGHAFPMLALGAELAARGHEVTYETWSRWREHVEAAGMRFVPAPEYPLFPGDGEPFEMYEAVVRATGVTRRAVAEVRPDVVVHDILTLAPAMAGELEGVPVATLIPHLYPVGGPGFPPYALGARLPRTRVGRLVWEALDRPTQAGLRRGRSDLNDARVRLGLPPLSRLHGGLSERLCMVATFPQLEYPRSWPEGVHVVGPVMWEPPFGSVDVPPGVSRSYWSHRPRPRIHRTGCSGPPSRGWAVSPSVCSRPGTGGRWASRYPSRRTRGWSSGSRTRRRCRSARW